VYPPDRFVLVGFKLERELDLLASGPGGRLTFIRSYPIQGMSGTLGPKLREGDRQVPEGIYSIVYLNPNSVAHVSLALSYPNDYDRAHAAEDGRHALGGDIMIHGGSTSIGCIAIGDEAAEELFVLAADAGWEDAVVVVSPVDFRRHGLPADYRAPAPWVDDVYVGLRAELARLPAGPPIPEGIMGRGSSLNRKSETAEERSACSSWRLHGGTAGRAVASQAPESSCPSRGGRERKFTLRRLD
jgi:hypothetical protein